MAEYKWKPWPEECDECGYELEVFSSDPRPAWVIDGETVRCPNCGMGGTISCSAEDDAYALMDDEPPSGKDYN
jgi:hypothetical protein